MRTSVLKSKKVIISAVIILLLLSAGIAGVVIAGNSKDKRSIGDKLELGEKYLSELKYEEAILVFKEVVEIDPRNVDAYLGISESYVALNQPEEAIKWLDTAITRIEEKGEVIEGCEELYIKQSEIYKSLGQLDQAEDALNRGYRFTQIELFLTLLEELTRLSNEESENQFEDIVNAGEETQMDEVMEDEDAIVLPDLTEDELNYIHEVYEALKAGDVERAHKVLHNGKWEIKDSLYYDGTQITNTHSGLGMHMDRILDTISIYYGDLVDGIWEGKGIGYISNYEATFDYYQYVDGEWKDGKANGYGKTVDIFVSGEGFEGEQYGRKSVVEGTYKDGLEHGRNKRWESYSDEGKVPIYEYEVIEGQVQEGDSVKYNAEENMYQLYDDDGIRGLGYPADNITVFFRAPVRMLKR